MTNTFRLFVYLLWAVAVLFISACATHLCPMPDPGANRLQVTTPEAKQALLLRQTRCLFRTSGTLHAYSKEENLWQPALPPMRAVAGRNGIAAPGMKREGDGRTPSGEYHLGLVFGYGPSAPTRMPYRQATENDLWVDDSSSPDYNRWVRKDHTHAQSFENMKRDDDLYKYGIVIEYNTDPVVPGHGSAIFMHLWKTPDSLTAGCIAVSEEDMLKLLAWLDPTAGPVIIILPE